MAETIPLNGSGRSGGDRPPRGPESAPDSDREAAPPTPKRRSPADTKLQTSIAEMYQVLGLAVNGLGGAAQDDGMQGTGVALVMQSEGIASAWMDLAEKNPKVKKILQNLTEVSAVGAVVGIHVTCAMPFLQSRGILPAFLGGTSAPEPTA